MNLKKMILNEDNKILGLKKGSIIFVKQELKEASGKVYIEYDMKFGLVTNVIENYKGKESLNKEFDADLPYSEPDQYKYQIFKSMKDAKKFVDDMRFDMTDDLWKHFGESTKIKNSKQLKEGVAKGGNISDKEIVDLLKDTIKLDLKKIYRNMDLVDQQMDMAWEKKKHDALLDLAVMRELYRSAVDMKEFGDTKPEDYIDNVRSTIKQYK